jgi:hypothetical protein
MSADGFVRDGDCRNQSLSSAPIELGRARVRYTRSWNIAPPPLIAVALSSVSLLQVHSRLADRRAPPGTSR